MLRNDTVHESWCVIARFRPAVGGGVIAERRLFDITRGHDIREQGPENTFGGSGVPFSRIAEVDKRLENRMP